MGIPHLLAFSLLILAPLAPAAAQYPDSAPSAGSPEPSPSVPLRLVPPLRFGGPSVRVLPDWKSVPPFSANQFQLSPKTLDAIRRTNNLGLAQLAQPRIPSRVTATPRNQTACYAIRSYDFARDNQASDATRFTGSSTCESVASVQLKAVANPRVAAAR